ncbi:MAG TPA: CPBP family glutamic-type intramembrane protease [Gemmatimonadales bacterium]|nr:CPBP family glutamic-type intramembrane protease [Gemmatimonadales bacterium]
MPTTLASYWQAARAPRYSLTFAFPLLLLYEILAFTLSGSEFSGVRNGADVLLKTVFVALGGRSGLVVFGALLVGGGAWIVVQDRRKSGRIEPRVLVLMAAESIVYALAFGLVTSTLTGLLIPGIWLSVRLPDLALGALASSSLATQVMISLGAGIYEELLFRVILVSGLAWLARRVFGWRVTAAGLFAVGVGALIFSGFHYIGPYGDRLTLGSFAFRTVAGILFSSLYLLRGFGITAWTHALYDVFLALG